MRRGSLQNSSMASVVPSVEWLSMTMRLNLKSACCEVAAHFLQVFGAGCFHLQLAVAVLRIHVVEDFLAAASGVVLHFGVEVFVDVY